MYILKVKALSQGLFFFRPAVDFFYGEALNNMRRFLRYHGGNS